ncbi:hypothetical protein ACJMK2_039184 [Sinanodonta woodiana]|uniref:DUF659 domain-containing protein n=1 Tax=Sinanodonta woodiana TaxID=1069815 RepID=A0ABD3WEK8_SINWO
MRPYSVVDLLGFRNLIHTLEPRYIIPSRTHFAEKVIPDLYLHTRQEVQNTISEADSVAITTDGWTSGATESYITITAHLIDKEWCMKSFVLQTRPCHESHTGKNIGAVLVDAGKEWQLERPHKLLP